MPHSLPALLVAVVASGVLLPALAADCSGRFSAGYRVLPLDNGRKVAVWYPTEAAEQPPARSSSNSAFAGRVARDAPPAACPPVPLVLFSHGWGGCARQSIFLTEELARAGYVVAAPDHADAACRIGRDEVDLGRMRIDSSFLDPASWNERSEVGRLHDLRAVIGLVAADPQLARIADTSRVGAVGHSLGGYAALAMAGGWPTWKTPQVKAVLALSPYALPFLAHGTLPRLQVPVMYQGAALDWGMTTSLEGPQGAYAATAPPKYFVRLAGGSHFEWTNLLCAGTPDVPACLQSRANAALIDRYAVAFLDRHLKGRPGELLDAPGRGLDAYRYQLRPGAPSGGGRTAPAPRPPA
jgi:predicted dienelactone hydrolase